MNELVAFLSVFFPSQVDLSGASDCSTYVKEELLSPEFDFLVNPPVTAPVLVFSLSPALQL